MNVPYNFDALNRFSSQSTAPVWLYWAHLTEMILIFFSFFWAAICVKIVYMRPLFHSNLMRLVLNMFVGIYMMQLSRFIVCLGGLIDDEVLSQFAFLFDVFVCVNILKEKGRKTSQRFLSKNHSGKNQSIKMCKNFFLWIIKKGCLILIFTILVLKFLACHSSSVLIFLVQFSQRTFFIF